MSKDRQDLEIDSAGQLREWLAVNHETSPGVWLVRWKKGRGPYVSHPDVVRELLCVGWIDSQARKVDDDRSAILEWISSAKREETRARRIAQTVAEAGVGRRANQPRQPGG
jgi:uncharacterized protein YdeI (YjbR/CyaY-like superfamily)